ncbi:hypothetical protein V5799_015866 [Amblyomma americanum]|uniref:Uncharacterized protein n=1 Tax=Amblyomma americanum TaxID=6943 RepID=A0AAQ4F801_AMBAM
MLWNLAILHGPKSGGSWSLDGCLPNRVDESREQLLEYLLSCYERITLEERIGPRRVEEALTALLSEVRLQVVRQVVLLLCGTLAGPRWA